MEAQEPRHVERRRPRARLRRQVYCRAAGDPIAVDGVPPYLEPRQRPGRTETPWHASPARWARLSRSAAPPPGTTPPRSSIPRRRRSACVWLCPNSVDGLSQSASGWPQAQMTRPPSGEVLLVRVETLNVRLDQVQVSPTKIGRLVRCRRRAAINEPLREAGRMLLSETVWNGRSWP